HQWEWCESQQDIEALDKAIAHYRDAELLWEIAAMECEDINGDTSPLKAEPIRANGEAIEGDILDILGRDCRENDYQDETPSLETMLAHF
ncbi:hypothetical protein, partial [Picosynechococcus sp. PCC 7002]|uniref:hypothetical protein n=1 Tax=Picosynechococcus sp. (strain ATCC 27264 / PCC 7002 / PR-6) TaxID=32049 RepID=UPI0028F3F109